MKKKVSRILLALAATVVLVIAIFTAYTYYQQNFPLCQAHVQGDALIIRVINSSGGGPISGIKVSLWQVNYCGDSKGSIFTTQTLSLGDLTTQTNGTVKLASPSVATYLLRVYYSGLSYDTNVTVAPINITNVVIYLPSEKTNVTYSLP